MSARDRLLLRAAGLVLACAAVGLSAYAGPLLEWSGGVVDQIRASF